MAVKFELSFTQTPTMVVFLCTLLVAVAVSGLELGTMAVMGGILRLLHLGTFSTWLGTQVWVTFFAGLTMYRVLPRHTFGHVQGKLFPKYFRLGTGLSTVSLLTYILQNPLSKWETQQMIQGISLFLGVLTALANLLYFEPQTTKCTLTKHKYEREVSAGQAIGKVEEDKLEILRKNKEYVVLEKRFSSLHAYSAIANLLSLAVHAIHLWHLSYYLSDL